MKEVSNSRNLQRVLCTQLLSFLLALTVLVTDYSSLICTAWQIMSSLASQTAFFKKWSLARETSYVLGISLGWQAMKKNSVMFINLYGVCCSMLGVFPMGYVLYSFLWTRGITSYHYLRFIGAIVAIATNGVGCIWPRS